MEKYFKITKTMSKFLQPEIIYKYRIFSNTHLDILRNNKIYFASPSELNDPWDMSLKPYLQEIRKRDFDKYYTRTINKGVFADSGKSRKGMKRIVKEKIKDIEKFKKEYIENLKNSIENCTVFSASEKADNILMWSHYSKSFQGFCIGFDSDFFENIILSSEELYYLKMDYVQEYPKIHPISNIENTEFYETIFKTKFDIWNYEKEVRFLSLNFNGKKIKEREFPEWAVKEVILGLNCTNKNEEILKGILRKKYPNTKLYRLKKIDYSFDLIREELDYN